MAFCDQDDVWRPGKLARMARAFDDPAVMLAYHNAAVTDRDGRATGRLYGPDGGRKRTESSRAEPWTFSLGFTQVFRRDLVDFTPLQAASRDFLFPRERLAHDQWFFFLASCLGRVAFVDEDLVAYRQHGGNVFGSVDRGRARRLAVIRATLDHSRGQVAARGASLTAKAAILDAIAADAGQPDERRARAAALARHHEDMASLYAGRVGAYGGGVGARAASWARLVARAAAPRRARPLLSGAARRPRPRLRRPARPPRGRARRTAIADRRGAPAMRVNFVLPLLSRTPIGGFRVVFEYADHLARHGHAVTIVYPRRRDCRARGGLGARAKDALWPLKKRLFDRPLVPWHELPPRRAPPAGRLAGRARRPGRRRHRGHGLADRRARGGAAPAPRARSST